MSKKGFLIAIGDHYSDSDGTHAASIAGLLCEKENSYGIREMLNEPRIMIAVVLSDATVKHSMATPAILKKSQVPSSSSR